MILADIFWLLTFETIKSMTYHLMIAMERLWGERCFIEYLCWCDMLINLGLFYLSLEHWSYDVLKCEKLHNHVSFFCFSLILLVYSFVFILLFYLFSCYKYDIRYVLHRVLSHITHYKLTHKCSNSVMRVSNFTILIFQLCLFESSFLVFIFQDRPF